MRRKIMTRSMDSERMGKGAEIKTVPLNAINIKVGAAIKYTADPESETYIVMRKHDEKSWIIENERNRKYIYSIELHLWDLLEFPEWEKLGQNGKH